MFYARRPGGSPGSGDRVHPGRRRGPGRPGLGRGLAGIDVPVGMLQLS